MDTVWLTYDELADRLGIERESARQQVKRKHWPRRKGNDGKVRIGVPEEVLSTRSEPATVAGTNSVPEPAPPPIQEPDVSQVLNRHIERLEEMLQDALARAEDRDELASQRDAARSACDLATVQVEALRAALAAAERDRDRWHDVATTKPAEPPRRTWWQRLAG